MGGFVRKLLQKKVIENEVAVSEVIGAVLLVGIVVIMISAIGAYIFSLDGPDDVPHTRLQECIDSSEDSIYMKHGGGEFLNTENCEIVLNYNGEKYVYSSEDIYENLGNKSVWELGDVLTIDARSKWNLDIKNDDEVELFLIDTPSKQPIQIARLTKEHERKLSPGWITPQGGIYTTPGFGYGDLEQVKGVDCDNKHINNNVIKLDPEDRNCTTYCPPYKSNINTSIYQEFDFNINTAECGLSPGDTLLNVTLRIVYYTHDSSYNGFKIKFYDIDESGWIYYEEDLPVHTTSFEPENIPLTNYINTTEDLQNFKVRIEAGGGTSADKEIFVDYIAIWIE